MEDPNNRPPRVLHALQYVCPVTWDVEGRDIVDPVLSLLDFDNVFADIYGEPMTEAERDYASEVYAHWE